MGHSWASHSGARLYIPKVPCTGRQGSTEDQGALPETGNVHLALSPSEHALLYATPEPSQGYRPPTTQGWAA